MSVETGNRIKEYMLAASKMGARLWRRNVGTGWIGRSVRYAREETVSVRSGDVLIRQARPFHNGEAGQSDLWGWVPVTITADMVGQTVAVHVEVEDKSDTDRERPEQKAWRECVNRAGGRAVVARSVEDVRRMLNVTSK